MERSQAVVVDAGPLYALVDRDDPSHQACLDVLESLRGPLHVPMLALTEVAYFVGTRLGPEIEVRFLSELAAGVYAIEPVHAGDWMRIAELVARYRDLPLGTVDASVVATAERLRVRTVVTLDRRHFSVVRPNHVDAFELLP